MDRNNGNLIETVVPWLRPALAATDRPGMQFDHHLGDGQSQTQAAKPMRTAMGDVIALGKCLEDPFQFRRGHANSGIGSDFHHQFVCWLSKWPS